MSEPGAASDSRPAPRDAVLVLNGVHRIAWFLSRAEESRGLLTVRTRAKGEPLTSLVLGHDITHQHLYIDEPHPRPPSWESVPGALLQITGRVDGNRFEFEAPLETAVSYRGAPALRLTLPEIVRVHERRRTYRVATPLALGLPPLQLRWKEGSASGRLLDISREGICTMAAAGFPLAAGAEASCLLTLPNASLQADVEVCAPTSAAGRMRIGLRFLRLTREQEQLLSGAISEIERRVIRVSRRV